MSSSALHDFGPVNHCLVPAIDDVFLQWREISARVYCQADSLDWCSVSYFVSVTGGLVIYYVVGRICPPSD